MSNSNKIIIEKEKEMTDFTAYLDDASLKRNKKGKTYHYLAILNKYHSAKNIEKDFFDVTDLERGGGWSLEVNTGFLDDLEVGAIIEIGVNLKSSNNYSFVSKNYFLILENDKETITVLKTKTPNMAFKEKSGKLIKTTV